MVFSLIVQPRAVKVLPSHLFVPLPVLSCGKDSFFHAESSPGEILPMTPLQWHWCELGMLHLEDAETPAFLPGGS